MTKTAVRFSFDSKGFLVKHIFHAPQLVESCGAFFTHTHSLQGASYRVYSIHIYSTLITYILQKASFYTMKGYLLHDKRTPFTV